MARPCLCLVLVPPLPLLLLLGRGLAPGSAFNLDAERPAVYSGSEGSYFGFAVDFFAPDPSS